MSRRPTGKIGGTNANDVPKEYLHLLKDSINSNKNGESRQLKRKKKRGQNGNLKNEETEAKVIVNLDDSDVEVLKEVKSPVKGELRKGASGDKREETIVIDGSDDDDDDLNVNNRAFSSKSEEKKCLISNSTPTPVPSPQEQEEDTIDDLSDDYGSEEDFDDFEDVDLENIKPHPQPTQILSSRSAPILGQPDDDVVNLQPIPLQPEEKSKTRKRPKKSSISKDEKQFRETFHKLQLTSLLTHGLARNKWCNNSHIQSILNRKHVTPEIDNQLHAKFPASMKESLITNQHKTRKFLDGLKALLDRWQNYYKITSNKGLHRYEWHSWPQSPSEIHCSEVSFERFEKCLEKGRGNRDIGAQGFVSLLRAAGVTARLCFSLQVPEFGDLKAYERPPPQEEENIAEDEGRELTVKEKISRLRKGKISNQKKKEIPKQGVELSYPVWWSEAWDPYAKKWYVVSPHVIPTIEDIQTKSKLEPPASYKFNQLRYVIGYDNHGFIRDVTQRYAEKYHTRISKRRVTRTEEGQIWYDQLLNAASIPGKTKADEFEEKWFKEKTMREGMPDTLQDFKNHPFYVLERDIKHNEVLQKGAKPCGLLRVKGKNQSLAVFRRDDVLNLRTARGWFHKGYVLKPGQQALKTKPKIPSQIIDEDVELEERLYSKSQVQLYVPPPITKDGIITKNHYGNLEVYVPSMIPEGGVLLESPLSEDAARALGIDYARAVTGFKFERGRKATPHITGIVVAADFKDAVESVSLQLKDEAEQREREEREIRAIRAWRVMLTKLRIKVRLNAAHGRIDDDQGERKELEKEYEEYLKEIDYKDDQDGDTTDLLEDENEEEAEEESDDGGFGGGFIPEPEHRSHRKRPNSYNHYDDGDEEDDESDAYGQGLGVGFSVQDADYSAKFKENGQVRPERRSTRSQRRNVNYKDVSDIEDDYDENGDDHMVVNEGGFIPENPGQESEREGLGGGFFAEDQDEEASGYEHFLNQMENEHDEYQDQMNGDGQDDERDLEETNPNSGGFILDDNQGGENGREDVEEEVVLEGDDLDEYEAFFKQLEQEQEHQEDQSEIEQITLEIKESETEKKQREEIHHSEESINKELSPAHTLSSAQATLNPLKNNHEKVHAKRNSKPFITDDDFRLLSDEQYIEAKESDLAFEETGSKAQSSKQEESQPQLDEHISDSTPDFELSDFIPKPSILPKPISPTPEFKPPPLETLPSKSLEHDEDLEREFREQVQREESVGLSLSDNEEGGVNGGDHDEDGEFEYDSE